MNTSATELWTESRAHNHHEILGALLRAELKKETVLRIDLSYLGEQIDTWWSSLARKTTTPSTKTNLRTLIQTALKPIHLEKIQGVGLSKNRISAVLLECVFTQPDKELARLVHEAMSEISGLIDIKYPYEDHKELYPKENDGLASDWGRGLGIIRPHSDDLYEERAINAMCLTVCKDTSSTPTWFWMLKDVVACLSDEELGTFALSEGIFISGKNVENKMIEVRRPILRRDPDEGFGLRLDFRIDDAVGPRMRLEDRTADAIFAKMREGLKHLKPVASNPSTGSVSLLANYKILHGRSALNPVMLTEGENSRILFRSKGMK